MAAPILNILCSDSSFKAVTMIKLILVTLSLIVLEISGHGMMLDPPNRSSLWRFDEDAPPNYEDNQNFCGGFEVYIEL